MAHQWHCVIAIDSLLERNMDFPEGFLQITKPRYSANPLWELALQGMAVCQPRLSAQAVRYRQQGWLPQFFWVAR